VNTPYKCWSYQFSPRLPKISCSPAQLKNIYILKVDLKSYLNLFLSPLSSGQPPPVATHELEIRIGDLKRQELFYLLNLRSIFLFNMYNKKTEKNQQHRTKTKQYDTILPCLIVHYKKQCSKDAQLAYRSAR
jgi:hypothetical protein